MRPLLVLILFTAVSCNNQIKLYNDWFDMNLSGNPKCVKEMTILSLIDSAFPQIDSLPNDFTIKHEYYFDSNGILIKEFQNIWPNPKGDWIEYREYVNYKDSVIVKGYSTFGNSGSFMEKRLLDKNGYMIIKTNLRDTIQYLRNSNNKIERKIEHLIGIDSPMDRKTEFKYNDHGDIEFENISEIACLFGGKLNKYEDNNRYKYIYDDTGNWIIQICLTDSKINSITQRAIIYK
jgi:hypothetical protein